MIKAGFIVLTLLMAVLAYMGTAHAASLAFADKRKQHRVKTKTIVLLTGWLSYISILSLAGVFTVGGLPPRIPLLLILPVFAFMFYFVRRAHYTGLITMVPASWLVYAQTFRVVVELMLHGLFLQGILPKAGTFEGYNYEIVIAITALAVGYWGYTRQVLPRSLVIFWHFAGLTTLAIVVFIMISHAYIPHIYPNPELLRIEDFGSFPYTYLAGFLMPLAVFMHILSLVKLFSKHKQ